MAEQTLPDDGNLATTEANADSRCSRLRSRRRNVALWLLVGLVPAIALFAYFRPNSNQLVIEPPAPSLEKVDQDIREAVQTARDKVLREPNSSEAWGRLGLVLLANNFPVEAGICFGQAEVLDSNDARWPYYNGVSAHRMRPDRAIELFRRAASLRPESVLDRTAINIRLAEALLEQQELDEAESLLRNELELAKNNDRAIYNLALLETARGRFKEGKSLFGQLRDSPFARKKSTANLAAVERRLGDDDSANRLEKEARDLPDDVDWMDNPYDTFSGTFAMGLRNSDKMAFRFRADGKYAEAVQITVQNAQNHPRLDTYISASIALGEAGNYDAALYYLRKTLEMNADYAESHYLISSIKFFLAEKDAKTDSLRQRAREQYQESIAHARRAVSLKPDFGIAYYYLGRALGRVGEKKEAVEQLRLAVKCRPELATAHLFLAEALWEQDEKGEAIESACNARELWDFKDLRFKNDYDRIAGYMNDKRLKPLAVAKQ